ncbi:MAG: response regulator [Actinobacteria bacterium]|nr:response regulator [Actinomycetota bacterium]
MTVDREALRRRLRALFVDELDEHVGLLNRGLLTLEQGSPAAEVNEVVNELFRSAHSLKGAARAAEVRPVETVCHRLEDVLARMRDGSLSPGANLDPLFRAVDFVAGAGRQLRESGEVSAEHVAEVVEGLAAVDRTPPARPRAAPREQADVSEAHPERPTPAAAPGGDGGSVRVAAGRLETLLNQAGEVLLAGQRVHRLAGQVSSATEVLLSHREAWGAARAAVPRPGAGHEATGMEQVGVVLKEVGDLLVEVARSANETDRHLSGTAQALVEGVRQVRMLPLAHACEGLPRTARDLARVQHKEVRVELEGTDVELDRPVLEGLREPLLHIVRNAVDHGIELPEDRRRAGKPSVGRVAIACRLNRGNVVVTVTDDGGGVDAGALRLAAERRGVEVAGDDPSALVELAFVPGVSTSVMVTEFSGRGVGLDAVRARVEALGGSVAISSAPGEGTEVSLQLPLTLSAVRVLLVAVGDDVFALPSSAVSRLIRVPAADLRFIEHRPVLLLDGHAVPVLHLGQALGLEEPKATAAVLESVLVDFAAGQALLAVDSLLMEEEVVMKPVGKRLAGLAAVLGATILPTGRVVMILNPAACARAGLGRGATLPSRTHEEARPTRVLLVEDTITTRALERSILEAAGYQVAVAVDGADGWRLLQEEGADLVVSDVNMPRMDGLALCEAVRSSSRFRELPFVLVTSLASEEDRRRGVEVGADAYIVKGDFDQGLLLETIERLR